MWVSCCSCWKWLLWRWASFLKSDSILTNQELNKHISYISWNVNGIIYLLIIYYFTVSVRNPSMTQLSALLQGHSTKLLVKVLVEASVLSKGLIRERSKDLILSSVMRLSAGFSFSRPLSLLVSIPCWYLAKCHSQISVHQAHNMAVCFIKSKTGKAKEVGIASKIGITFFFVCVALFQKWHSLTFTLEAGH